MTDDSATGDPEQFAAPVSLRRLEECRGSAYFWVNALPEYADKNQSRADWWSIRPGLLAAVTSLSIFTALGHNRLSGLSSPYR